MKRSKCLECRESSTGRCQRHRGLSHCVAKPRGRKPRFKQSEIDTMRELFNDPARKLSAAAVGRIFRCSGATVAKAVDGTLTAKDPQEVARAEWRALIDAHVRNEKAEGHTHDTTRP